MENQTGYNLNAAVEDWRRELAAQAGLSADERRELETHLQDAIAGFRKQGLNDEESFWLARRRVGQPQELGEEFAKADPAKVWRGRLFWMVLAVFLMETAGRVPQTMSLALLDAGWLRNILVVMAGFIPLIAVMLLGSGKMTGQLSKAAEFINSRFRFASTILILILVTCGLNYLGGMALFRRIASMSPNAGILSSQQLLPQLIIQVPKVLSLTTLALLLIWLLPKGNRKDARLPS
jgi:hypothetical protein